MEPSGFPLPRTECFPAGLRVLVVDDDLTWLKILERMLKKCNYEVTTCGLARVALDLLRGRKDGYDIVISDVNMPDMDGFKLLEQVGLEMDIPVIMMSVDGETSRVMKGVQHGACDYLLKPIRMKELRNIWQHVFRKRMHEVRDIECFDMTTSVAARKRKDVDGSHHDPAKKARVVWTVELHQKFVKAVNRIGFDKAGPKKILDLMNVEWLTRENVASHLQKYRLYLTRLQKGNGSKATFGATNDAPISAFYQSPVAQKATAMLLPPHHILANETKIKEGTEISFDYQSFDPLNSTVKSESTASAQLSWATKGQAQPCQSKQHGPFHNPGSSWNFDKPTQAYCRNKVDGSSWDFEKLTQHGRNKMNEVALENEWQHKMHGLATEDGNAPALFTVQPQSHPNGFHHVIDFIPFSSWDPKKHGLQKDPFGDQKNTGFDWDENLGDYLTNEELPDDFFGNVELFGFANHKMIADFVPPLHDPLKFDSGYSDHMEYPVIYQGLFIT